jgi:hypothetical protein
MDTCEKSKIYVVGGNAKLVKSRVLVAVRLSFSTTVHTESNCTSRQSITHNPRISPEHLDPVLSLCRCSNTRLRASCVCTGWSRTLRDIATLGSPPAADGEARASFAGSEMAAAMPSTCCVRCRCAAYSALMEFNARNARMQMSFVFIPAGLIL